MKLNRFHALIAGLPIVLGGSAWFIQSHDQATTGVIRSPAVTSWFRPGVGEAKNTMPPADLLARFKTGQENLPGSLRGAEVPDELFEDSAGNLKLSRGVRNVFDYFLSAGGEESDISIYARLKTWIGSHLHKKATAQAIELLNTYVDYKNKLEVEFSKTPGQNIEDIRTRIAVSKQMRAQMFTRDAYEAFFSDDEAYDEFGLARLTVIQDSALSATEKAKRIAEAKEKLPASIQKSMNAVEVVQTLEQVTAQWDQQGGSPQQLRTIREQLVGIEAANRLDDLDKRVAAWDARVQNYLAQRDTVLKNPSLSEEMKHQQVATLQQGFNKAELVRIDALERIHDSGETISPPRPGS